MRRRRLFASVIVLAAAATLALTGCANGEDPGATPRPTADDDFDLVRAGTLTVCVGDPAPPFHIEEAETSGHSGFDIDLVTAIAGSLDLKVAVLAGVDDLRSGAPLAEGVCDIAASALTISEENRASLDFSDPYYDSLHTLLVRAGAGISSLEDLGGRTVGVQRDGAGERFAEENTPEDAGVVAYASEQALWSGFQAGNVDAVLQERHLNTEHARADSAYTVVAEYEVGEHYGFAFARGSKDALRAAVNAALAQLRSDGVYQEIHDEYFAAG